jgi:hypothetical protein
MHNDREPQCEKESPADGLKQPGMFLFEPVLPHCEKKMKSGHITVRLLPLQGIFSDLEKSLYP